MSFRICPECGAENTSYHCDECGRVERTPEQIALDVAVMQREPALTRDRDRLAAEVRRLTAERDAAEHERDTAIRERDDARADMEAAEQNMLCVLDGTFSVGDGTAQREIERLRAENERLREALGEALTYVERLAKREPHDLDCMACGRSLIYGAAHNPSCPGLFGDGGRFNQLRALANKEQP